MNWHICVAIHGGPRGKHIISSRTLLRFYEQRNDISARWGCLLAPYDEVMKGGESKGRRSVNIRWR
jgi:hypothetical protein